MRTVDTVLESSGSLVWDDRNFETFGYHSGYKVAGSNFPLFEVGIFSEQGMV